MATYRLLIAYAHPDDESFGNGGLIAKYVAEGVEVYYICATDGDRGTIPDDMQGLYPSVRELRLAELACAARVLGFKRVFTFHYKDSGMMGSVTNQDPDCLWYHSQQPDLYEKLVLRVVDVIREIKPHVVLTFNKYGGYGHPDHIAIHRATTEAFMRAGDPTLETACPPYRPQKLYYAALPARFLKFVAFTLRLRGMDLRHMGRNKDIDYQAVLDHLEPAHALVDVHAYLDKWHEANACHKSQGGGGMSNQVPKWLRDLLVRSQGFTRVYPKPTHNRVDERDLFAGVVCE